MTNISFALTALFLLPTAAFAEDSVLNGLETSEITIGDGTDEATTSPDQDRLDTQDEGASLERSDLNKVERPANAVGPLIVTPKFDFGAGLPPETDTTINPYEPVPEPAPGFVIRIPTN